MPSDAEQDALRERDPERIYLEPAPYSPEGRVWCEDDVWPLEGDGPSGVEYVRADLVRRELGALADRDADNTTFWERRRRARVRWEHVNDTAAVAYETLPHPHKPRVRAWISVADPDDLHRCMMGVERALAREHAGSERGGCDQSPL